MSANIHDIFVAAPASSMLSTDLLYLGRSPYGITNDMAITFSNFNASIRASDVATDTGTADAYAIALAPAIAAYTNGLEVAFTPTHASLTTTPTLAVNGLAAKTIVLSNGALQAGDLTTSMIAKCIYSSAANAFVLLTPVVS